MCERKGGRLLHHEPNMLSLKVYTVRLINAVIAPKTLQNSISGHKNLNLTTTPHQDFVQATWTIFEAGMGFG